MRIAVAALLALLGAASALNVDHEWQKFLVRFGKAYHSEKEANMRRAIFADNLRHIEHLNRVSYGGVEHGVNQFSDMTSDEFRQKVLMTSRPPVETQLLDLLMGPAANSSAAPSSFDWREKGAVTGVKDQGSVGTCWAFSTTGAIEGAHFLASGKLLSLSEEFLTDCDDRDCSVFGGWPYLAYQYILGAGGIPSEAAYPYCSGTGNCYPCMANKNTTFCGPPPSYCNKTWDPSHCPSAPRDVKLESWQSVSKDEGVIASTLASVGPLSTLMDATNLQSYKSGIWAPQPGLFGCKSDVDSLDHAVLLVGYGTDNGTDYWLVKNSWGESWGEKGFFRIKRGDSMCGINTMVTFPKVQH
mmetsp:Transcript_10339/g.32825  ORF Transcript_10339/g.32825 Transcript_10339/m.32825 type:complete len:356 (+) Transcript_10339:37-1104(+)